MHRLELLGHIDFRDDGGTELRGVLAQPKRFALLAYLALDSVNGPCRRDRLLGLFWPELDQERARKALNKSVHFLRQELGDDVLVSRSAEELAVDASRLWCDANAFVELVHDGKAADALELYRGELLPSFYIDAAPAFEEWLEQVRSRVRRLAGLAARDLARDRERDGHDTMAVQFARRAVELTGEDERLVRELLELLDRLGDRAGAIQAYDDFARRLAAEYDAEPAAETKLVVDRIRSRVTATPGQSQSSMLARGETGFVVPAVSPSRTALSPVSSALADLNGWRLERELGRGGMATVYLARDEKHERYVALKMLRPEVASSVGAERFLQEIQITARLAHPHILPLIDSGVAAGALYLVTPHVRGESLRERLRRERQLPVDEALRITREIAAALDYAHREGVVHRDVKPENILLQDGHALVADFGIALVLSAAAGESESAAGLSPGTPSYMSPEQVAGERELDVRSDVYSLGAVLYEMLVGLPPHTGHDRQELVEKVLTEPVRAARALRETVPLHVDAALQKALAMLPADRFVSAAEFARALDDPGVVTVNAPREFTRSVRRSRDWWFVSAAAAVLAVGFLVAPRVWYRTAAVPQADESAIRRTTIVLPDSAPVTFVGSVINDVRSVLAIAPDASVIAYVGTSGKTRMLYTRRLDDAKVRPLIGTEGARAPFFSPDGRWIAYFADSHLFKVATDGGQPVRLADLRNPVAGVWLPDGRIVVHAGGVAIVSEQGGAAVMLQERGPGSGPGVTGIAGYIETRWLTLEFFREISFLALGDTLRRFVLTERGTLEPGDNRPVPRDVVYGLGPTVVAGSHLVYGQSGGDGVVLGMPFDTAGMRATGKALPVLDDVRIEMGVPQYAIASDGTLAYVAGRNEMLSYLVIRDRGGKTDTLPFPRSDLAWINLSRDGHRVVAARWNPGADRQWVVMDLARGMITPLPDSIERAIWSPDSRTLLATKIVAPRHRVTLRMSPVTGQVLDTVLRDGSVFSVDSSEGVFVVRGRSEKPEAWIVWRDSAAHPPVRVSPQLGATVFPNGSTLASISPSGKWIALTAGANGRQEVFVAPTNKPDERVQISTNGGEKPLWNADESEIVYENRASWYAVSASLKSGVPSFGEPRLLFEGPYHSVPGYSHGLMPDGHRHLILVSPSERTARRIEVVAGWAADLRRRTLRGQ